MKRAEQGVLRVLGTTICWRRSTAGRGLGRTNPPCCACRRASCGHA